MSLIHELRGANRLKVGARFRDGNLTQSGWGHTYTNLLHKQIRDGEIHFDEIDFLALLGFGYHPPSSISEELFSDKPPQQTAGKLLEYSLFREYFQHILDVFGGTWAFTNKGAKAPGEHPVTHRNIVGRVASGSTALNNFRTYGTYEEPQSETLYHPVFTLNLAPDNTPIVTFSGADFSNPILRPLYGERFDALVSEVDSGQYDNEGPNNKAFVCDLRKKTTATTVTLTHTWVIGDKGSTKWRWHVVVVTYHYALTMTSAPVAFNQSLDLDDFLDVSVIVKKKKIVDDRLVFDATDQPERGEVYSSLGCGALQGYSLVNDASATVVSLNSVSPALPVAPLFSEGRVMELIGWDRERAVYLSGTGTYNHFHQFVESNIGQLAPGNFYSSQDAIKTSLSALDSNYIENLLQIRGIIAPLDLLKAAKVFLSRSNRGGFVRFMKFLANADLTYRFGIAPLVSDAQDIAKKIQLLLYRFREGGFYNTQTIYGKHSFTNLDVHPRFNPIRVDCRSKIRVIPTLDSYLPYVLPLEALGLMPSFSRMWDIVPLSWVVDGVYSIDDTLQMLDASLLQMAFEVEYSTHSIRTKYEFTVSDMVSYDFEAKSDGEDSPGYQHYLRYSIVNGLPILGPSILPLVTPAFTTGKAETIGAFVLLRA
jgi:hypothetical protein